MTGPESFVPIKRHKSSSRHRKSKEHRYERRKVREIMHRMEEHDSDWD